MKQDTTAEYLARVAAQILGESSEAYKALQQLDRLRSEGKEARIREGKGKWIVEVDE